jgi:hypothetical protein
MPLHIGHNQLYNCPAPSPLSLGPPSSPHLPQQRGELEQLPETKMRASRTHEHSGIFRDQAGPLGRDRPQSVLRIVEVDPVLTPVVAPRDYAKLAPGVWVERMSDPETFCRIGLVDRSRRRTRMRLPRGG